MIRKMYNEIIKRTLAISILSFLLFAKLNICAQSISDSIYHNGIYRTYLTYLPTSYNASSCHSLVFVLHGGSGNAEYMAAYTQFNLVADTADFIIVYPEGIYTGINIGGQQGHEWADGRGVLTPDSLGIDDVDFFNKLIDTLLIDYNVCTECIFAAGISNGGIMSQRLASEFSDRFAAVASVAASFPDSLIAGFNPSVPISVLFMNGTNDPITPVIPGGVGLAGGSNVSLDSAIALWSTHNQCVPVVDSVNLPNTVLLDLSSVVKYSYSGCHDSTEIVVYKIINGGHTWPQENDTLHVPLTGLSNQDINGSGEIWNFFRTHCKNTGVGQKSVNVEPGFKLYPNPTNGKLRIKINEKYKDIEIGIYTVLGDLVQTYHNLTEINMQVFEPGIYYIKTIIDGKVNTAKILKID